MSHLVSGTKPDVLKDSLLFLFDLAYKIRFTLPLLLFASFLGFDFQIQIVSEDDDDAANNDNADIAAVNYNVVYNLNSGLIIENINLGDEEDEDEDQSVEILTNESFELASENEDLSDGSFSNQGSDFE
uniref:Uncharacterized protein n=1 Tax=Cacopsylla melanoneura TaxID=428564 RepID=A0A8D9BQR7_9HEMI